MRIILTFTIALLAGLPAGISYAQDSQRYIYGPHMMGWDGGWAGMILGPFMMILFFALTIAVAVLLVRWMIGPPRSDAPPAPRTALDILAERYARGEIDKAEYEERRRALGG